MKKPHWRNLQRWPQSPEGFAHQRVSIIQVCYPRLKLGILAWTKLWPTPTSHRQKKDFYNFQQDKHHFHPVTVCYQLSKGSVQNPLSSPVVFHGEIHFTKPILQTPSSKPHLPFEQPRSVPPVDFPAAGVLSREGNQFVSRKFLPSRRFFPAAFPLPCPRHSHSHHCDGALVPLNFCILW